MSRTTILALLFILSGMTADAGEIRLRAQVECAGPVVRLGDVAEVHAADVLTQHRLAAIALFPRPDLGRTRLLKRQELRELLTLSAVSLQEYRVTGATVAQVTAPPVAAAVEAADVQPAELPAETDAESASVQMAVFTTRPLQQGTVVQAADVQLLPAKEPRDLAAVAAIDDIIGRELTRSLPAGQPVPRENVQSPRLVQRGDDVTVQSLAAGIKITTNGKSLEAGGQGDVVEVELADSRERLFARIVALRTVAVYAAAPTFAGARTVNPKSK